jgi:hypothetical protein
MLQLSFLQLDIIPGATADKFKRYLPTNKYYDLKNYISNYLIDFLANL